MTLFRKLIVLALLSTSAVAATLSGTVTNKTTNKPAAGDEVILLKLGQGMDEAGRTKTDAAGKFTFKTEDGMPYLVRVIHQTVTYHAQVPPGQTTADIDVYDAAKKIDNLSATVQVMRFQAQGDKLQITELYALKNASSPPRTLMADQTFQIALPEGAQVDDGQAISGTNGLPVASAPVPSDKPGQYYFVFPLRPGETRFQVSYHLAYKGEIAVNEKILYPMEHFVVMTPKSMTFTPANAALFQAMGDDPGSNTQVSTTVKAGDTVAFKVAGTGEFPPENEQAGQGGGAPDNRPGGGLGPPIDAPDPLQQYRWYIIGGLAVAMIAGAFYVLNKKPVTGAAAAAQVAAAAPAPRTPARPAAAPAAPVAAAGNGRSATLLEALKEELFQLEIERQQGHITQAEYEKAKAALDVTIGRALNRAPTKRT